MKYLFILYGSFLIFENGYTRKVKILFAWDFKVCPRPIFLKFKILSQMTPLHTTDYE